MIRTVVFLALVAYASALFSKPWGEGFSRTLMQYAGLPQNLAKAMGEGYEMVEDNAGTSKGYEDVQLWMNAKNPCVGLLFNATGGRAGIQINIPVSAIVETHWTMEEQGLQRWTSDFTGSKIDYYRTQIFIDSENVKFEHDSAMMSLPRNTKNIDSDWKEQACMPFMGTHYYHNMTTSTTCDKPFPHLFGLSQKNTDQLIGFGFMVMGSCKNLKCFENPDTFAVKMIVNKGPQCLYDMVKDGVCTMHVYLVDSPALINCLPSIG